MYENIQYELQAKKDNLYDAAVRETLTATPASAASVTQAVILRASYTVYECGENSIHVDCEQLW